MGNTNLKGSHYGYTIAVIDKFLHLMAHACELVPFLSGTIQTKNRKALCNFGIKNRLLQMLKSIVLHKMVCQHSSDVSKTLCAMSH